MRSRQAFTSAHTVVAQVLAWSVHISETGIGPKHGFYGEPLTGRRALMADKPLAGGYAMIFSGWTGDWKARKECHFLTRHYGTHQCCEDCAAVKPQINDKELRCLSYENLSENAPLRQTLLNFEGYKRAALRQSPWAAFRGFHNQIIFRDWLHVVALGLGRDEVASAMWEIVHMDTVPGLRKDQQLGLLLQELRTWSRKAGRSIGKGLKSLPTYILKKTPKDAQLLQGGKGAHHD